MSNALASAIWNKSYHPAIRIAAPLVLGVALLTASAKMQIPFWPVPMTLQTLAVLLIGATCGARLAVATVAAYVALGAAGLPVFASGAGPAYLAGPTGGYLAGFALAAWLVGSLADRDYGKTVPTALAAIVAGAVVIYVCGAAWLSTLIGFDKAVAVGVLPFLPAEATKVGLAAVIWRLAWKGIGK